MNPAVSQICTLASSFEDDVVDFSAGACKQIEVWFTKLESYLNDHTIEDAHKLLREHEVLLPAASMQGGLLVSQGEARKEHWRLFEQRLDLCGAMSIPTVVVACDIPTALDGESFGRLLASLELAAKAAESRGRRVAVEFQAESAFVNNLQTAVSLVAQIDHPHLGVCLDAFHFYKGPSKTEDLGLLSIQNLFHVQVCDLLDVPREFASDADRILPGDGELFLEPLVRRLQEIGYTNCVSVELMNPRLAQVPPRQFGEIAITALRRLLGQASMG